MRPVLYGAAYSVYVRIARMTLLEKGVEHDHVAVDVFASAGPPAWYIEHHPFQRIPAFTHGTLHIHETSAITRYVDEAFAGPALQPSAPANRASMNQLIGIVDAYAYRTLVWDIYVERVSRPSQGKLPDDARIAAALPIARICLTAISKLMRPGRYLLGDAPTLADIHLAPVIAYFVDSPEGRSMIDEFDDLSAWWSEVSSRDAFTATPFET